jgi:hypothetical protein
MQYHRRNWMKRDIRFVQREASSDPLIRLLEALVKGLQATCTSSLKGETRWFMNRWIDMMYMTESDAILQKVSLPSGSLLSPSYQTLCALR